MNLRNELVTHAKDQAEAAVAAAAIVAARRVGDGATLQCCGLDVAIPAELDDLVPVAVAALRRVMGEESELSSPVGRHGVRRRVARPDPGERRGASGHIWGGGLMPRRNSRQPDYVGHFVLREVALGGAASTGRPVARANAACRTRGRRAGHLQTAPAGARPQGGARCESAANSSPVHRLRPPLCRGTHLSAGFGEAAPSTSVKAAGRGVRGW
jgi:hypothetical protein